MGDNGINVSKKDVIWSFVAKFFQMATGILVLPLILNRLSSEEIALNYLMLTISSMVALLDFGFAPQFGRNFTYVYSGSRSLQKEGVVTDGGEGIDYHLLSVLLLTAKGVYRKISLACLLLMLLGGSFYIYYITNGFSLVNNSLLIWLLFSFSTFITVYSSFYNSLLVGSGKISEANKAIILSKTTYIVVCCVLLLLNFGLFSVVLATFSAPLVQILYSHTKYYTKQLREKLDFEVSSSEVKEMFSTIWYNAKKLGLSFVGGYAVTKSSMFIIGFYLSLEEIASYGLLVQIGSAVTAIASTLFITYHPKCANCRVSKDYNRFKEIMSVTMLFYLAVMLAGYLGVVFLLDYALVILRSNAALPSILITSLYFIYITLEGNHSNFASLITTDNKVPFLGASLISGGFIVLLTVLTLQFTNLGLLGVVLVPLLVQLAYNNWRWPKWVLDELNLSYWGMLRIGMNRVVDLSRNIVHKSNNR